MTPKHRPFLLSDGRMVGTGQAIAVLTARHRRQVARYCEPIGKHRRSGAALYDVETCEAMLRTIPRRNRRTA